jgi:hypothetical protein
MNELPLRTTDSPPTAAPSLRRAIGWTAAGFVAILVASIAACGDPVGRDGNSIAVTATAATGGATH